MQKDSTSLWVVLKNWRNLEFFWMIDLTEWFWGWNVGVNWKQSVFSFWTSCSAVNQFVGHCGDPLEQQEQDTHVCQKTGTLPRIFWKNKSQLYLNYKVWETLGNRYRILDMWWMQRWIKQVPMWICRFVVNTSA